MKLLTQAQASTLLAEAYEMVRKHQKAKYRLGQAIFNLLPEEVAENIYLIDGKDPYYMTDEEKVLKSFYDNCVERE